MSSSVKDRIRSTTRCMNISATLTWRWAISSISRSCVCRHTPSCSTIHASRRSTHRFCLAQCRTPLRSCSRYRNPRAGRSAANSRVILPASGMIPQVSPLLAPLAFRLVRCGQWRPVTVLGRRNAVVGVRVGPRGFRLGLRLRRARGQARRFLHAVSTLTPASGRAQPRSGTDDPVTASMGDCRR
jgi:hypothetical protein